MTGQYVFVIRRYDGLSESGLFLTDHTNHLDRLPAGTRTIHTSDNPFGIPNEHSSSGSDDPS